MNIATSLPTPVTPPGLDISHPENVADFLASDRLHTYQRSAHTGQGWQSDVFGANRFLIYAYFQFYQAHQVTRTNFDARSWLESRRTPLTKLFRRPSLRVGFQLISVSSSWLLYLLNACVCNTLCSI
ncbi:hypothetical protein F0562_033207 [Nyssa sinensis]|uniref:Uncharacterized protein n=1 Tax=Nyssa sinensis TaxID=561372 RepID=A0A5J5ARS6_9ASTE|nr:hypothetical protein F0562_033207 [Nyssa sinensis]